MAWQPTLIRIIRILARKGEVGIDPDQIGWRWASCRIAARLRRFRAGDKRLASCNGLMSVIPMRRRDQDGSGSTCVSRPSDDPVGGGQHK